MSSRWISQSLGAAMLAVVLTSFGAVAAPAAGPVRAHAAGRDDNPGKDHEDEAKGGPAGKGRTDDSGPKGNGPASSAAPATPATPATPGVAPATPAGPATPAAPAKPGKPDKPGKPEKPGHGRKDRKPSSTTPASTTVPAPTLPVATGVSAAPTVAFDTALLTPTVGQSVGVAASRGTVRIRTADGRDLHTVDAASAVPNGTRVDTRDGAVELTTAVAGGNQTATFTGAIFAVQQPATAGGLTQIVLRGGDFSRCRAGAGTAHAARAVAAAARKRKPRGKPVRSLWGKDDHGRFQTRGKGAVGTVRGTRWLTADYCNGTLTRVAEGSVSVYDRAAHRTVVVHAGHSYFAATR